ncbi:MAG: hypothetical protein AB1490_12015 [Pseudomonadota bacterium]
MKTPAKTPDDGNTAQSIAVGSALPAETDQFVFDLVRFSAELYLLSVTDAHSRLILGTRMLPAGPGGSPPEVTVGDALELVFGRYRKGTNLLEQAEVDLKRADRRVRRHLRSPRLKWFLPPYRRPSRRNGPQG